MRKTALIAFVALGLAVPGNAGAAPIFNLDLHDAPTRFVPGNTPALQYARVATGEQGVPGLVNELQSLGYNATSGSYNLTFDPDGSGPQPAETTAALSYDASAAQISAALQALPSIGAGNVAVVGGEEPPGIDGPLGRTNSFFFGIRFVGALAMTDVPQLVISDGPTPLGLGPQYWIDVENVGPHPTSGPITLTVALPAGVKRYDVRAGYSILHPVDWSCPGAPGDQVITCTTSDPLPRHRADFALGITVSVSPTACGAAPSCEKTATAIVSGGGAPPAPSAAACAAAVAACARETTRIAPGEDGFGIPAETFLPDFFESDGMSPERQAGAHPDLLTVPFDFTTVEDPKAGQPFTKAESGSIRSISVDLPPGFLGDPTAVGECPIANLVLQACPRSSQVGISRVRFPPLLAAGSAYRNDVAPVYNMSHPIGSVSDLAFVLFGNPVHIRASLEPASRYAVTTHVPDINETLPPFDQKLTIWGVPAHPSHDALRCGLSNGILETDKECPTDIERKPFLTVPSQCGDDNVFRLHHYDSWQSPGDYGPDITYTMPGKMTGCDRPRFEPSVEVEPTGRQANSPTGLDVRIRVSQNANPEALATPPVKRISVTLPEGMSFSPSFADGLQSCTEEQFGISKAGIPNAEPVRCPGASRIGEVEVLLPILPRPAVGSMYLAAQGDNPFNSTFALYLELEDTEQRGALVKIPGRIDVHPLSGQITTTFDDSPQFPFEEFVLKFRSGPRAPLINPPACGTHTIGVEVTSYARPDEVLNRSNAYTVTEGPNGTACPPDPAARPFSPRFRGGTLNPVAGSFSTFLFRLSRDDSEQELSQVTTVLPPGLLAKIAGIPLCPDAAIASISTDLGAGALEQAAPACPAASAIGTVSAGLGAGPGPNYFPGSVYLAGPYKGAPLSLVVVAPGLAGPFDLGNVVVRTALRVDPETSRVTAVTDPFPTILHGVILRVRDVRLRLDRPETTLNPTNCSATSLNAEITGVGGDLLSTLDDSLFRASDYFQVGDCGRLPFKPRLFFKLKGGTHRGDHPAFTARLIARPGDANIARAITALPRSEFLENAHIGTVCTRVQFREDACPAASVYGHAKAITPLLDDPVQGDLVLRSSDNPLPDLVARLRGQISANLVGRIDSVNGGIRTSFTSVPDVPVTEFTLTMAGGKKGLLVNSTNLCKHTHRADVRFTAQNGKKLRLRPVMQNSCKGKPRKGKRQKRRG